MAKFLDTQAISNELMRLIKDAKEKIILASYSFKVNPQIQERLRTRSKIGQLAEIVIVYGDTKLRQSDIEWMKDIDDLKIFEKGNLHAKCYLNEERAIICSMNLYDYSQQNNIEMGIMISRQEDPEAYNELIGEITNIKINGTRKRIDAQGNLVDGTAPVVMANSEPKEDVKKASSAQKSSMSPDEKLKVELLKQWRFYASKKEKINAHQLLTDEQIQTLATRSRVDKDALFEVLLKKNAIKHSQSILDAMSEASSYTIGKVVSVWYQTEEGRYDRVKLQLVRTGEEKWFDTTQELPQKDKMVAVKLNQTWFNQYFYLS